MRSRLVAATDPDATAVDLTLLRLLDLTWLLPQEYGSFPWVCFSAQTPSAVARFNVVVFFLAGSDHLCVRVRRRRRFLVIGLLTGVETSLTKARFTVYHPTTVHSHRNPALSHQYRRYVLCGRVLGFCDYV